MASVERNHDLGTDEAYPGRHNGITAVDSSLHTSSQPGLDSGFAACRLCDSRGVRDMRAERERKRPNEGGRFYVESSGRTRFVEGTYWAFIKGYSETVCDDLLSEKHVERNDLDAVWPHVDAAGLARISKQLPSKPVCDCLLRSFMTCVRPVFPLVHQSSFTNNYENFFRFQFDAPHDVVSDDHLLDDPTILTTIFAVLFCGATVAPPALWNDIDLQGLDRSELIGRFSSIYQASISFCQGSHYPTLHTLTALILGESCSVPMGVTIADAGLVAMMAKIAQSIGLHRENTHRILDAITAKVRRRIWWHILYLDLQSSILLGSNTLTDLDSSDVKMVRDAQDRDLSAESIDTEPFLLPVGPSAPSTLFMLGRYEVVRTMRPMTKYLQSGQPLDQEHLDRFTYTMKVLLGRLDDLMNRITARGVPEKGNIPVRIATASPDTQPQLYDEETNEFTVLGCWIRIMMHLLKLDSSLLLLRLVLGEAEKGSAEATRLWTITARCCSDYLRAFLQVYSISAFAPYRWFFPDRFPPLQPAFLLLTFVQIASDQEGNDLKTIALYNIDEVLEIYAPEDTGPEYENGSSSARRPRQTAGAEWKMLRTLRRNLNEGRTGQVPVSTAQQGNSEKLDFATVLDWSHMLIRALGS